jgi:hypothetical protein
MLKMGWNAGVWAGETCSFDARNCGLVSGKKAYEETPDVNLRVPLPLGQNMELTIEKLVYGGEGLAN